jgi:uncharacterized DUF497 family protein
MKIQYTLQEVAFEWDSQKATTNFRKHKIKFELAAEAFFDPLFAIWMNKLSAVNFASDWLD